MSKKAYIDLNAKKSVHINLDREIHAKFRTVLFDKGLSMQEVLNDFARHVAIGDPVLIRILDELVERKRNKTKERLTETDAETLFNILEEESPLSS